MRSRTLRASLIISLAGIACGGGGAGGSDDVPADAAERLAAAVCPRAYECCGMEKLMRNPFSGTDGESCRRATSDEFRSSFDAIRESQRRGRVTFDLARLNACLATIGSSTCAELRTSHYLSDVPGCAGVVIPKVALGGACLHNHDCTSGDCDVSQSPTGDGTCAPSGYMCDMAEAAECPGGQLCRNGSCGGRLPEGANCRFDVECQTNVCVLGPGGGCSPAGEGCFYESACSFPGFAPISCSVW